MIAIRSHLRSHTLIWLVIALIGVYRVALTPVGQDFYPDEIRFHRTSEVMLDALAQGNLRDFVWAMYAAQGRPTSSLLGMIPAQIQRWVSGTSSVIALWNVLASLALVWLIYDILLTYTPRRWQAAGGAAIYALMHSNSLYVRHLLPYDWALLAFVLACWIILKPQSPLSLSPTQVFACGLLCGIGFTLYPGYYPLIGLVGVLITIANRRKIPTLPIFALGPIFVVLVFQLISQSVDSPFIRSIVELSGTIDQGDYAEGYIFGVLQMNGADGIFCVPPLLLFAGSVILAIRRRDLDSRIRAVIVLTLLAYLAYGTLAVVFHKTVQYGRLIHMYMPFVAMGATLALTALQRYQRIAWATVMIVGTLSFARNATIYLPMVYPKEARDSVLKAYSGAKVCDLLTVSDWTLGAMNDCDFVAVNMRYPHPYEDFTQSTPRPFEPPTNWQPLYVGPHPFTYPPLQYEAYGPRQRAILNERPYLMAIYRVTRQ